MARKRILTDVGVLILGLFMAGALGALIYGIQNNVRIHDNGAIEVNSNSSTNNTIADDTVAETETDTRPSQDCNIKGNINYKGEKIYHLPGQKYYDSTKIDVNHGERWFCSELEAQAAGWRKSKV